MDELRTEIETIKERNKKVELDKAWETSTTRKIGVAVTTYILVVLVLWSIGNPAPFLNALIPTVGYALSVQSLPFLKKWWQKKNAR